MPGPRILALRRVLAAVVVLLTFGGLAGIFGGVWWIQRQERLWREQEQDIAVAERLCRPGETFTIMRKRRIGGKTSYTYECVGPAGQRRNISGELTPFSPTRQIATWLPLLSSLGAVLLGILIASFVLGGRPRKRRP
jgi:hypothetical protein